MKAIRNMGLMVAGFTLAVGFINICVASVPIGVLCVAFGSAIAGIAWSD